MSDFYHVTQAQLDDVVEALADMITALADQSGTPIGGLAGQVITKLGVSDFDVGWVNPGEHVFEVIAMAAHTLDSDDNAKVIFYTSPNPTSVTLGDIAIGHETRLVALSNGGLTIDDTGITFLNGYTPNLTISQGEDMFVKQVGVSQWAVLGGTAG